MSSSSRSLAAIVLALALTGPLAACTGLTPVYSERGLGTERVAVSYAEPSNRLEQIIYGDLALRLGKSAGEVPVVTVSASQRSAGLSSGSISAPNSQRQMTVTAKISVKDALGNTLFSGTRSQTADYTADAQALANQQAEATAARQAALLLSDTIRLEVIAALAK